MKISSPHDRLFKSAMSDIRVARDFFYHYLPAHIQETMDIKTLTLCPNSYVDQKLQLSLSDLLYKVKIADKTAYLYLLCEHQSTIDNKMPLRILEYMIKIWSDHLKQYKTEILPLVVPIVFYHGKEPYSGPTDIRSLIDAPQSLIDQVLFQPFHLIDTHHISDETLREQHWAGVMAFIMKHIYTRDILAIVQPLFSEMRKIEAEGGSQFLVLLLNYLLNTGDTHNVRDFVDSVTTELSIKGDEIMTAAERLIILGQEQGMQIGKTEMLSRLIERKFGDIPIDYHKKIEKANSDTLLQWSEKILEANNLESIFED